MTFIAATIIGDNLLRVDTVQLCASDVDILFSPRRLRSACSAGEKKPGRAEGRGVGLEDVPVKTCGGKGGGGAEG